MLLCYAQPCKTFRAYGMNSTVLLGTHLMLTLVPCQISGCKGNLSCCLKSKIAWTSCSHAVGQPTPVHKVLKHFVCSCCCWWLAKQRVIGYLALFWLSLVDLLCARPLLSVAGPIHACLKWLSSSGLINHYLAQGTGLGAVSENKHITPRVTQKRITSSSSTRSWSPKINLLLPTSSSDPFSTEPGTWRQHCARPAASLQGHSSRVSIQESYMVLQGPGNRWRKELSREASAPDLFCCTTCEISLQDGGSCPFPSHTRLPLAMFLMGGCWCVTSSHNYFNLPRLASLVWRWVRPQEVRSGICRWKRRGLTLSDRVVAGKEGKEGLRSTIQ